MTLEVLPSSRHLDAAANLRSFLELGRTSTAFGAVDWDADVWRGVDLTKEKRASAGRGGAKDLHFLTGKGGLRGATESKPLRPPFSDFAKALLRVREDRSPKNVEDHRTMLRALRLVHDELASDGYDPCLLLPRHLDAAASRAKGAESPSTAYATGKFLTEIARCVDERGIGRVRLGWKNKNPRPSTDERFGPEADARRAAKLPSEAALDALAKLAGIVQGDPDVLRMRGVELLACGGWRINELLTLLADCEVEEAAYEDGEPVTDDAGAPVVRYGIRYYAEKGFGPAVKWIPSAMVDVAKRAVADVRRITEPVRVDAAWMATHPGRSNVAAIEQGGDDLMTMKAVASALGIAASAQWCKTHGVPLTKNSEGLLVASRRDLRAALIAEVPAVSQGSPFPLQDHLFLIRENFVHASRGITNGTVRFLTDQMIKDFLGGGDGRKSVFERYGFTEPDGSPITVTSHQFRHWLNTLAHEGGMSQELIARWSGRKDVAQNAAYDHMTGQKLGERLRAMVLAGDMKGPIAQASDRLAPADREAFLAAQVATAHVTDIGICVHDWGLAPCPTHGDCANCGEHVVDKGNPDQRREVERQVAEVSQMLASAEAETADGTIGASRWVVAHRRSRDSLARISSIHADETIPDGTLVHLGSQVRERPSTADASRR